MQIINDLATTHSELVSEWHPTKNGDLTPQDVTFGSGKKVWWRCSHGHEWQVTVNSRTNNNSGCQVCSGQKVWAGFNDLSTTHPELAKQWDYNKNSLTPEEVIACGHKKVWWLCEEGHSYDATIANRKNGTGCPFCAGQKVWAGFNDLSTTHPELAKQWDYNKNSLTPEEVIAGSSEKMWWICDKGHSYNTYIAHRTRGTGCPFCSGQKVLAGFNDLSTTHPKLAKQWDCDRNSLTPEEVIAGSEKKVFWICDKGHSYQARLASRTKKTNATGCPFCAGLKALKGFNDLSTTNPEIAKQWDYNKNSLTPEQVTAGSNKKVFWVCDKGHSYDALINSRTRGTGCPFCSGRKALKGITDLSTTNPEIAEQWDYLKNSLTPEDLSAGSDKKVWWLCEEGHSYDATIANRKNGKGCPYCAGHKVLKGFNDLSTTHTELAKQWDYNKNSLTPEEKSAGSNTKVWWICEKGHSYEAVISERTRTHATGCPRCNASKGELRIKQFLTQYDIKFSQEHRFSDCKSKNTLPFDFYLPEHNICIEYQGEHHYQIITRSKSPIKNKQSFEKTQKHDQIKSDYCFNNNIKLLPIHYEDFESIEEILYESLDIIRK